MKPYYKYVDDVLNGNVITGANIQLACQRFQEDLNRDDLEFRESVVDRALAFISTMKHFKGKSIWLELHTRTVVAVCSS